VGLKNYAKKQGTDYLTVLFTSFQEKGEIKSDDPHKLANTIQNIIYAMKDHTYQYMRSELNGKADFERLSEEILYTVSLILDGVIVE